MLLLLCAVVGGLYNRHAPEAYMVSHKLTWRHSTEGWQLLCISILNKRAQICLVWLLKATDCVYFHEYSLGVPRKHSECKAWSVCEATMRLCSKCTACAANAMHADVTYLRCRMSHSM